MPPASHRLFTIVRVCAGGVGVGLRACVRARFVVLCMCGGVCVCMCIRVFLCARERVCVCVFSREHARAPRPSSLVSLV